MNANQFWDDFSFDYTLSQNDIFEDLIAIEGYKQAALNLVLPQEWSNQLDRLNRVRAVYGTTALEGNPLSEEEVGRQIEIIEQEGSQPTEPRVTKEQLQIRNAARAQTWVKLRFQPGSDPITLGDILTMHKMITERSDETNNIPGRLRTFSVQVGSSDMGGVHLGAPYETLPELMEEFIGVVNSDKFKSNHPVVRALLAHFFLVTIHPFGDGNGRVSRLLEAGILFQGEYNVHGFYGLSNYFYNNEQEYKVTLQKCRGSKPFDVSPFIKFGVKGFASELYGINNFIKTKLNRVVYRQMLVQNYNKRQGVRRRVLNAREYNLLDYLLTATEPLDPFSESPSRKITLSELQEAPYVKGAYRDVTRRTFVRELIRLSDSGFIKFTRADESSPQIVELDFGAIAKYEVS
ncbi:MAG: Fic family protein [Dehalococcoidia bacterium]